MEEENSKTRIKKRKEKTGFKKRKEKTGLKKGISTTNLKSEGRGAWGAASKEGKAEKTILRRK